MQTLRPVGTLAVAVCCVSIAAHKRRPRNRPSHADGCAQVLWSKELIERGNLAHAEPSAEGSVWVESIESLQYQVLKENLKTYLNEYKILTDGINISDGFVINIAIEFEVITLRNYNKSEVVAECINEMKDYFDINNWTFNNTINISELELLLANVDGVSSVPKLKIINKKLLFILTLAFVLS